MLPFQPKLRILVQFSPVKTWDFVYFSNESIFYENGIRKAALESLGNMLSKNITIFDL